MQGLDNDTSRYMNDYSGFQFGPDMFDANYAEAQHPIPLPSIAHQHEFPFEHAHRIAVPIPGSGFGEFDSLRPQISFDSYSCDAGRSGDSSLKLDEDAQDEYYKMHENQSSSSRSNHSSSGSKRKKSSQNLSNEEKRKISLEKNRLAASRCRKKRKSLLEDLERHAGQATLLNHTLTLRVKELETQLQMAHDELRALKNSCHCNNL